MTVIDLAAVRTRRAVAKTPEPAGDRFETWRRAERSVDFLEALRSLNLAAGAVAAFGIHEAATYVTSFEEDADLVARIRKARANLLLTPVPTKAKFQWKQRYSKSNQMPYTPVDAAELANVIRSDLDYLAIPRYTRGDAKRPRAVQVANLAT